MDKYCQNNLEDTVRENDGNEQDGLTKGILDILLDKDNRDPIVLTDGEGRRISFEQIAIIPYERANDWNLNVLLKPIDKIDGIQDDEAVVFFVDEVDGNHVLKVEKDESIAIDVFNEYYKLLDVVGKKHKVNDAITNLIKQLSKKRKGDKV